MGDLIGFEGYLNTSTPFQNTEHNALWKSDRRYHDFSFGNNELAKCEYPRFYGDDGLEVTNLTTELVGCRDSEFDQYGEIAGKHGHLYERKGVDDVIQQLLETTLSGNDKYQSSLLCKIAYGNGARTFCLRSSTSLALRLPCWTLMVTAWTKGL